MYTQQQLQEQQLQEQELAQKLQEQAASAARWRRAATGAGAAARLAEKQLELQP